MCCISLSNICSGSQAFRVDMRKLNSRWLWLLISSSARRRICLCSKIFRDLFLMIVSNRAFNEFFDSYTIADLMQTEDGGDYVI